MPEGTAPSETVELVAVAAVAANGVIGDDGEVPWTLPEDRAQYRDRVADGVVILGRRTFEAMLDDLPGRVQLVVSRHPPTYDIPTAHPVSGVPEAVDVTRSLGDDIAFVLGGAGIYALFQPYLDRMILSRVPGEFEGDARYPDWDPDDWRLVDRTPHDGFTVEEWIRRDPVPST